jgi:uroporphyrinogen-III decarboxylase
MTHKERILATVRGEPVDRLPFIPRLDIWYNSNKYNGTLPGKYKNATLKELTEDLDLGCHSIIPDFSDYDGDDGDIDIGLGIYRFNTLPYSLEFHNIERRIQREANGILRVEYVTPRGTLNTCVRYDEEMRKMGLTLYVILEHAVKGPDDFAALIWILENVEIKPDYSKYLEYKENLVGDNGVLAVFSHFCASPMHYLLRDLMAMDTFFYTLADYPDQMKHLADRMRPFIMEMFRAAVDCPGELILTGANYDSAITIPPFYREHIMPDLKFQTDVVHSKGKFLITHTDGENNGLLELYGESGFDVADSICPYPMTKHTLKEVRDVFEGKITIWGGIPSISVLESSMSEYEFEKYIDETLESIGRGDHIIFSIADTVPPAAKFDRILRIAEKVKEFGPVK